MSVEWVGASVAVAHPPVGVSETERGPTGGKNSAHVLCAGAFPWRWRTWGGGAGAAHVAGCMLRTRVGSPSVQI